MLAARVVPMTATSLLCPWRASLYGSHDSNASTRHRPGLRSVMHVALVGGEPRRIEGVEPLLQQLAHPRVDGAQLDRLAQRVRQHAGLLQIIVEAFIKPRFQRDDRFRLFRFPGHAHLACMRYCAGISGSASASLSCTPWRQNSTVR